MRRPLESGDFVHLPGPTNGFKDRVRRKGDELVCMVFESRWHGFARYEVQRRRVYVEEGFASSNVTEIFEQVESGWVWRGRKAPYYEFGPTLLEIHDDVLVDNR